MKEEEKLPKSGGDMPTSKAEKRLVRLPKNGKIAGVCAGLADYLDIDVSVIRIVFVILTLASGGFGVLVYFTLAIIMPVSNTPAGQHLQTGSISANVNQLAEEVRNNGAIDRMRVYLGLALMLFGVWLLLMKFYPDLVSVDWNIIWPSVLVILGLVLLTRSRK